MYVLQMGGCEEWGSESGLELECAIIRNQVCDCYGIFKRVGGVWSK